MPPVTRAVAFKYKADATDEQKRRAIEDLIKLYDSKANIFTTKPRGGKVQDAGWLSKGFDAVFVISFKVRNSASAR